MGNDPQAVLVADVEIVKIRLESLHCKLLTLENDKKLLKEEAEAMHIKAELLQIKARSLDILTAEILKEGTDILHQCKQLAENGHLGELREKLMSALEPLKSHLLHKQNS